MQMTRSGFLQLCMFILTILIGTQNSWATRCLEGSKSPTNFNINSATNTTHTTSVGNIKVTNSNQAAGTILWQSPVYTTTFTCYDDYNTNNTEKAYLYLDDLGRNLAQAFKNTNLIVGIRYNGNEYPIDSTSTSSDTRIDTGLIAINTQTNTSTAQANCTLIGKQAYNFWGQATRRCSDPRTITINYSLYIKSRGTGNNFNSSAQTYQVFQLDGDSGRNANGNFQEKISNVAVTYIDCVTSLNTQNVDLGSYYTYQDVGPILRRTPFTINVITTGKNCAAYPFAGKFTSTQAYDTDTITPSETGMKNVVGIKVYEAGSTQPIALDSTFDFGSSNGSTLTKNFEAGVFFLAKPSTAGQFSSTLNYEVYFK
ncbi:fimbrial protein [Acinetobacter soli]|uniref:fimbrial protein n=1 Tax=Acinetobacter soli TaxID=487316 RepID=UPI00124F6FD7|nr:fimbrial protein [Acinetobacter soli]